MREGGGRTENLVDLVTRSFALEVAQRLLCCNLRKENFAVVCYLAML